MVLKYTLLFIIINPCLNCYMTFNPLQRAAAPLTPNFISSQNLINTVHNADHNGITSKQKMQNYPDIQGE